MNTLREEFLCGRPKDMPKGRMGFVREKCDQPRGKFVVRLQPMLNIQIAFRRHAFGLCGASASRGVRKTHVRDDSPIPGFLSSL